MITFDVGGRVSHLCFLPDGKRLSVCTGEGYCAIWSIDGSTRVPVTAEMRAGNPWSDSYDGAVVAFHPKKPLGYLARSGRVVAFDTRTGKQRTAPDVRGTQLALSPDGARGLAAVAGFGVAWRLTGFVVGSRRAPTNFPVAGAPTVLGGFLPDGERFVTVEGEYIRIRSFQTGEYLVEGKHKVLVLDHSRVSPDGRLWAGFGHHVFYKVPLAPLGAPQRLKNTGSMMTRFHSFAFHPAGKVMAVIDGGSTLVKVYSVEDLTKTASYSWKHGHLNDVTFSPDGTLAAAGGKDGKVVVWDVDA
jgi:WD40 repeat protein